MLIYIDESGSVNNHDPNNKYFVIALVHVKDKKALQKAYKRFVSSNLPKLKELDQPKIHPISGVILREGGKMFSKDGFKELKGAHFDKEMKQAFVDFFSRKPIFELYYIKIRNRKLSDTFCRNTARVFNYPLKLALEYFIRNGLLPDDDCSLQLDERNEKTNTRYFLEEYLNTELCMNGTSTKKFDVTYFDSANNHFIQIADVFANLFFSHLKTGAYKDELQKLREAGILRFIFEFPL